MNQSYEAREPRKDEGSGGDAAPKVSTGPDNVAPGAAKQTRERGLFTVTVGSKPSDADAWLPGVDAVVSLLRSLTKVKTACV